MPGLVVSHEENRKSLQNTSMVVLKKMVKYMDPGGFSLMKGYKLRLPNITFTGRLNLYLGGQIIELLPLPGHVTGGIGIYLHKERTIFVGDVVFNKVKSRLHEAEPEIWYQSLEIINKLDVEAIVPGHGNMCDKKHIAEQRRILQGWVNVVSEAIKQGWSVEMAKERIICPDPYPVENGIPFANKDVNDMCITRLYDILKPQ